MRKLYDFARLKVVAYAILALIAAGGLYQGHQAVELARTVDHSGDIRACTQENLIRTQSNIRDAKLQQTAKLVSESLLVLSKSERQKGDLTNLKLRVIAAQAKEVQTAFLPAKITDCNKAFPKP